MPRTRTAALTAAVALLAATATAAAPSPTGRTTTTTCSSAVFGAGTGGYASYRIPALVMVDGVLIALAEGRRTSAADTGDIDVVERRSLDGGCTWQPHTLVADAGSDVADNPVPLVTSDGTLVLVTNGQSSGVTQAQIEAGTVSAADGRRVYVQSATDAGATWTPRREITAAVKDPSWRWLATGPGHGVAIVHGTALGRLVVAAVHTAAGGIYGTSTLLSDDDGATWRRGALDDHDDGVLTPDETTAAELPNGRLYFSSRNEDGSDPSNRSYTLSLNSGSSFAGPAQALPALVTPRVEGSLMQDPGLPAGVSCHPLLYSGPEDPAVRQHLTIRRSDDSGMSWHTVTEITGPAVPAAYSDMVKTDRTHLGVLYETGATSPYEQIRFTSVLVGCP